MKPPVFIVTTGENGAGLVTGLLDSHPQLAVLPAILDFYEKFAKAKAVAELPGIVHKYPMIARIFDGGSALAYGDFRGLKFSREEFTADFLARIGYATPSRKLFFEAAFLSLCKALRISTEGKTPVVHIHYTENLAAYAADYPDARWIICDAKRENMLGYSSHLITTVLPKRHVPFRLAWQNRVALLDRRQVDVASLPSSRRVMYEDVLTDPRTVADALADWLGIERSEVLYNSTALGRPLSCTYPTGTISVVDGSVTGKNIEWASLLKGQRRIMWPIRFSHYRTERAVDARYTARDFLRSVRASLRQCAAEIRARSSLPPKRAGF